MISGCQPNNENCCCAFRLEICVIQASKDKKVLKAKVDTEYFPMEALPHLILVDKTHNFVNDYNNIQPATSKILSPFLILDTFILNNRYHQQVPNMPKQRFFIFYAIAGFLSLFLFIFVYLKMGLCNYNIDML